MKIETQARDDNQTRLIAEIDAETFDRFMHQAARKISRDVKIPGFRPGKAPYDVVRRMYGDQALQQEAVELMLDEVYPAALQEANITPSGAGKLDEIVSMDPPTFAFIVPLPPVVDLPEDYLEIRKEYAPEPITDEQVEQALKRLQRGYATAEPVERHAQAGDLVSFKMSATRVNPEEGEMLTLIDEGSYQMVAGENDEENENWPYKDFTQELVGLSAEETKTWTYTFSEDTVYEDLRGKEAEFKVEVQNVKELHLPELNEEFAQSMGDFENLEALRAAIRTQLEQQYQQQYDQNYYDELIEEIVSKSTIKYPPHLLEEEIEDFLHGVQHSLERDRLDLDTYLKMRQMDRETFIDQEVKPAASRRLERSLVLGEFARREGIEVKDEEIRSIYYAAMQQMQQQSKEIRKLQTRNKQNANDLANSIAASTVNNIFNQRLMDRLKAIATGKADEEPEAESEEVTAEAAAETPENLETPANEAELPAESVEAASTEQSDSDQSEEETGEKEA